MRVCQKQQESSSRRKTFDMSKQRALGTDLEGFLRARGGRPSTSEQKADAIAARKKGNWKTKHEDFIHSIRSARVVTDPNSGAPLPPSVPAAPNPDYVQCPHCKRRFQDHTAERHIPFCKEQSDRIERKPLSFKAKKSLSKRIQYKPPPLRKRSGTSDREQPSSSSNPPGASVVMKNTNFSNTYTISDTPNAPSNTRRNFENSSGGQNRARTNSSGIPHAVKGRTAAATGGGPLTKTAFPKYTPVRNTSGGGGTIASSDRRQSHTFQQESGAVPQPGSNARPLRQTSFSKRSAGGGSGSGGVITKRGGLHHNRAGPEDDFSEPTSAQIHAKSSIRRLPLQNADQHGIPTSSRQPQSRKVYTTSTYEYSSDEHVSPRHSSQTTDSVFHGKKPSAAQMRLTSIGGSDHSLSSASVSEEELLHGVMEQPSQTHALSALKRKPGVLKKLDHEDSLENILSRPSAQGLSRVLSSDSYRHGSGSSLGSAGSKATPLNAHGMSMSKFCYECGCKFPVPQAKYCCECGTKRI